MRKSSPPLIIMLTVLLVSGCSALPEVSDHEPGIETISDAPNVQKITFYSEALQLNMRFNLYLPPGYSEDREYPVLYVLHGYSANEDAWFPGLGADRQADQLITQGKIEPLIIVAPQINNSYGVNSAETAMRPCPGCNDMGMYNDYLVKDLIPYVEEHYQALASREGRYIGGISMGGWAALHTAFQYPELFSKAGGHSPALFLNDWSRAPALESWLYPDQTAREERDPIELAQTNDLTGLAVYLDCGAQDHYQFYEGAEALHRILEEKQIESEFHLNEGEHVGEYWAEQMEAYLLFYANQAASP